MAIILKANKVNLFVSSVLNVFWYHSPNFLDTPRSCVPSGCVPFDRPLPPGANPVAVNKRYILSYHRMPDLLLLANTYYGLDMAECNFRFERYSLFVRLV
jgi:hypothetical protein